MKFANKRFLAFVLALAMLLSFVPSLGTLVNASGTLSLGIDGLSASYGDASSSGTTSWTYSNGTITGTLTGKHSTSFGRLDTFAASDVTLTFKNDFKNEAVLRFSYIIAELNNTGTFYVNGTEVTADGSFEKTIAAGAEVEIKLSVAKKSHLEYDSAINTATITISNLSLVENIPVITTFKPATNGSYTVDGSTITASTSYTNVAAKKYVVTVQPNTGYSFGGWKCEDCGMYFSSDTNATTGSKELSFAENHTVVPQFVPTGDVIWGVGESRFVDLDAAISCAKNGTDKVIVLLKNTTITGDYTIPAGVTLQIPFDANNTSCIPAAPTTGRTYTTPYAFRTLTMADGASLTVNGNISVDAQHSGGNGSGQLYSGSVTGPYGLIAMQGSSTIDLKSGANLYAWGFITGEGTVNANSGATVYEKMQITDFRGGSATMGAASTGKSNAVFPFSQYYVQNVQVKEVINHGATLKASATVNMDNTDISMAVDFIASSGAMFVTTAGSKVTKYYDAPNDRLIIDVEAGSSSVSVQSMSLDMSEYMPGLTVNSADFVLPINSNITINIKSGTVNVKQDIGLLPSARVNVAQGAALNVLSGSEIYVYDVSEWGSYCINGTHMPIAYAPGKGTRAALGDAVIDVNGTVKATGAVYTTASGAAIISSEGTGRFILLSAAPADTTTKQYAVNPSLASANAVSINVTSAQLKNGDSTYTATKGTAANNYFYYDAAQAKWVKAANVVVSFNGNGATGGSVSSITITPMDALNGVKITIPENGFTKTGHTFSGWNTKADGTGTAYTEGASAAFATSTTLYATWEAGTCYILIEYDEEDMQFDDGYAELAYGDEITDEILGTPTKDDYVFDGWVVYNSDMEEIEQPSTMTEELLMFVAKWTLAPTTGTVSFQTNGGSAVDAITDDLNATFAAPSTGKTNYVFQGWATTNGGAVVYKAGDTVTITGDATLYAVWAKAQYTVSFETGNTASEIAPITKEFDVEVTLPAATRTGTDAAGYVFAGWDSDNDGDVDYSAEQTITLSSDLVLYPVWEKASFTVTYKYGNATLHTDIVKYGDAIPTFNNTMAVEGKTFKGWDAAVPATMPAENLTFNAVYETNTYTVSWDTDGDGVADKVTENVPYGTVPTAPEASKSEYGYKYTFLGWSDTKDSKTTVEVGAVQENVTYYAVFKIETISYTVTFDVQGGENVPSVTVNYLTQITLPTAAKTGYSFLGWATTADAVEAEYTDTYSVKKNVTLYAVFEVNKYNVAFTINGEEYKTVEFAYGAAVTAPDYTAPTGYTFSGWNVPATMPAENITRDATLTVNEYNLTISSTDFGVIFEGKVAYGTKLSELDAVKNLKKTLYRNDSVYLAKFVFDGWFDWNTLEEFEDISDVTMPAMDYDIGAAYAVTGWISPDDGDNWAYCGDKGFLVGWGEVNEADHTENGTGTAMYYFVDLEGNDLWYVRVNDLTEIEGVLYAFDHETGAFLSDYTGLYTCLNGDIYYVENGIVNKNIGLVRTVTDEGVVEYYYFCNGTVCNLDGCAQGGKAVKNAVHWIEINNDMLVKWDYTFGEDGVIEHHEDTTRNGVYADENGVQCYYIDGVKVHYGLFKGDGVYGVEDGYYYYARSTGALVKNETYWISVTNGLLEERAYTFDKNGRIVFAEVKDGIYAEDGSLYLYKDGQRFYRGLFVGDGTVGEEGYYYYANTYGEIINGKKYWISKTNDLLEETAYTFNEKGQIVFPDPEPVKDGFVNENGATYYYVDGIKTYAGVILVDGAYYYVNSEGKVVKDCKYWISKSNGIVPEKAYVFDADGKMDVSGVVTDNGSEGNNGIVTVNGKMYYYVDGVRTYAGLIEIDGALYYVNSSYEVVTGGYWISKTNGILPEGRYEFDETGKMITQ